MSEKDEGGHGEEGEKKKKGGGKKILLILIVLLLAGGGGAFFMLGGSKGGDGKDGAHGSADPSAKKHLVVAKLDPAFVVNLAGSGSFLKCSIWLQYDATAAESAALDDHGGGGHGSGGSGGAKDGELSGILKTREPMIRDAIIRVLSSKRADEVLNVDQRDTLKEELLEAVNESIGATENPIVTAVMFAEFIVQ
jgi:flagellar FliL protein